MITGAQGFTGIYVRKVLETAGYEVFGAKMGASTNATESCLDITSLESCRQGIEFARPDYIVHLAAISFVAHQDPLAFYSVNVIGTLNLLQALKDTEISPRKILIASSATVYGNTDVSVITETQVPQPVNHYGASKLAMEHIVTQWFDRLPIVITRPFNYTGVGQAPHFLIPKIVSHFAGGKAVIELGNLDVEREFSDVRMVAEIYKRLLESDSSGEIVNVCSGQAYSLRQILAMSAAIAGYEIEVQVNPAFVRKNEVHRLTGSVDKLRRLINPIPPYSVQDTLKWMYQAASLREENFSLQ